jgi:glycerate kinase
VARIARSRNKPVWAIAGLIADRELVSPHFDKLVALVSGETSLAEALEQPRKVLYQKARDLVLT